MTDEVAALIAAGQDVNARDGSGPFQVYEGSIKALLRRHSGSFHARVRPIKTLLRRYDIFMGYVCVALCFMKALLRLHEGPIEAVLRLY